MSPLTASGATTVRFADGKVTFEVTDGDPMDHKYELGPAKDPKVLDIVIEHDGKTIVVKCIYLFQGNTLKICGPSQPDKPRPTEFKVKENEQDVYVLNRVRKN